MLIKEQKSLMQINTIPSKTYKLLVILLALLTIATSFLLNDFYLFIFIALGAILYGLYLIYSIKNYKLVINHDSGTINNRPVVELNMTASNNLYSVINYKLVGSNKQQKLLIFHDSLQNISVYELRRMLY